MARHVLASHPEAQSLLSEAGHCRVLAEQSADEVACRYGVMQAARNGYEELRHRLDPRRARPIHFGAAMGLLATLFAVLVVLDVVTFDGVMAGWVGAAAVAAAAAWIGCAWLAALALREEQRGRLVAIVAGALALGALLVALHGTTAAALLVDRLPVDRLPVDRLPVDRWYRFEVGAVTVLLVFVLVAVAAMLIARTEPASLLLARRRWHHSRSAYAAAVRIHRGDAEAEAVARQGWHGLIQAHVQAPANGDGQVIDRR
jgi:MFS family permease